MGHRNLAGLVSTLLGIRNLVFDLDGTSTGFDHALGEQIGSLFVTEARIDVSDDWHHVCFVVVDLLNYAVHITAIGFCFGGLCALDVARSNADAAGVVSFHGLLNAPGNTADEIKPKVLALHGWDDPMATPDDVKAFGEEMTKAKADWQLHAYGGTMHAFTNPQANDPDFGTVYDADADRRSWQAMQNFLTELF